MMLARGRDHEVFDRAIDVQVSRLRKLVEPDPSAPRYIQTVWGFGYVYVPDDDAAVPARGDAAGPDGAPSQGGSGSSDRGSDQGGGGTEGGGGFGGAGATGDAGGGGGGDGG
jgi:hypothetical protein